MYSKKTIISKVKALLEKTEQNGASKAEMEKAMSLAIKLMRENYISEHDLTNPYLIEKCILLEVPLIKSAYDFTIFYGYLAKLFDCEHFYNSKRIAFFGFEEDTELCQFFYTTIIKSCLYEKEQYINSNQYFDLKKMYHGRTLVSSFIKGFLCEISFKMHDMYQDRNKNLSDQAGLVLWGKMDNVKSQFIELNRKIRTKPLTQIKAEKIAFNNGREKGKDFQIMQGIKTHQQNSTLSLN